MPVRPAKVPIAMTVAIIMLAVWTGLNLIQNYVGIESIEGYIPEVATPKKKEPALRTNHLKFSKWKRRHIPPHMQEAMSITFSLRLIFIGNIELRNLNIVLKVQNIVPQKAADFISATP